MVHDPGHGMMTDQYELTMLDSFVADGGAGRRATFELFARRLPTGRRYGVVAGTGRLMEALADFRFSAGELDWLTARGVVGPDTAEYLAHLDFAGVDIDGYPEGELYFPGSPVLTITGPLGACLILETLALSIYNHDSAIASAGARMVTAAHGRPLIEMGSRRTHENAAIAAARAAYLVGFASTSNLAAGMRYGLPTVGTAAHAFTLAHATEAEAFASQIASRGAGTTLLVDTYDIEAGIRTAVQVAGPDLGAVRIDSGDLNVEARRARALLDSLGAHRTRITVTSDLDEYVITALADAPIDAYGVGTRLVTGSGHPSVGMVYKLVAVADDAGRLRPVEKRSVGKGSVGGRKVAWREYDDAGHVAAERIALRQDPGEREGLPGRRLDVPLMRDGTVQDLPTLEESRAFHARVRGELAPSDLSVSEGPAATTARL